MKNLLLSTAAWTAGWLPMPVKRALYRIRPLAGLIRGGLNRAAPPGLATVNVAAGALAGLRLSLDLQSEKDYWLGTYEPELQAAIDEWVEPGWVAYDVGANIGYISLALARKVGPGGRVFCFEALPTNLARLAENLALNGMGERVQVVAGAVVDRSKPVRFIVGPSGAMGKAEGSAGRQEGAPAQVLDVEGLSLDQFVYQDGNPPPQVVKIDIEGGEILALPGMERLLQAARPLVFLELHGPQAAQVAWRTLSQGGYRLCRMAPGYPQVRSLETLDWKAYWAAFPS